MSDFTQLLTVNVACVFLVAGLAVRGHLAAHLRRRPGAKKPKGES